MGRRALGCRIVWAPSPNHIARLEIKYMKHAVKSLWPLWISSCNFFFFSSLSINEIKVIKQTNLKSKIKASSWVTKLLKKGPKNEPSMLIL